MRSSGYCSGVVGHLADGLFHAIFELVQGDGLQVRPFGDKRFDDGGNDDNGSGRAGAGLHHKIQGGVGGRDSGAGMRQHVRPATEAKTSRFSRIARNRKRGELP